MERILRRTLTACGAGTGKAGDGGRFGVVNVEDGNELGKLHHFVEFMAEIAEAHGGAGGFGAEMSSDQGAETRAVDVIDFGHIENDFGRSAGYEALEFFAESVTFLAQDDTARQSEQGDAVDNAFGDV